MYDIVVIGGGLAGSGLACALAGENASIALVEEKQAQGRNSQDDDARGIALSLSSRKLLDETGLWSKLEQSACPVERIHVSTQGRYGCVRMSADMLDHDALGFVVHAQELGRTLFEEVANHDNIDIFCPATAAGIERDAGSVTVHVRQAGEDTALKCKLLVIADGAFSNTRELAGIKTNIHDYSQTAIVSNVSISRDHRNTAYERFTPDGLIALLPLKDDRCVTVLVIPADKADGYVRLDNEEYLKHLQQTFGKRLGSLSQPGARKAHPLFLLQPEQQTHDRIVLLGNAAHTVHPNGAQGFNLVLRDVAALAAHLGATLQNGGDVGAGEVLNAYGLSRKVDQRRVIRFSDSLQRAFNDTTPLKSVLRNSAMWILDALPPLKKEFIRQATGLGMVRSRGLPRPGGSSAERGRHKIREGVSSVGIRSSASRSPDTELLIVGGGVVGGSMALLAASNGIECILVERNRVTATKAPAQDARVLALTPASRKILSVVRAWQQLAEEPGLFKRMHVWDENGNGNLYFDSADIGQATLAYTVRQNVLVSALESVREGLSGVTVCAGAEPVSLSDDRRAIRVKLSDGRELSAKLLIAADGTGSKIRQLAGMDYAVRHYRQTAVASIVRTVVGHGQIARQRFLTDGPLAFLPLADPHRCGVVWSTTPAQAAELLAMDKAAFQQALADAFGHTLGAIPDIGVRQSFPLQRAQARRYCSNRIALVGDAAHCVHPLAGLGANLGLLDVASLFQVISEAGMRGRDPGSTAVLRKYERWRKGENFMVMMALESLKYLFENQTLPVPPLRNAGMGLYNSFQALKNFTMRRATGLDGDLPDFVKQG